MQAALDWILFNSTLYCVTAHSATRALHGMIFSESKGCHLEQDILRQAQLSALHDALSGTHPVHIPPQGVDFTIVANHSHGLRPAPAGEGVGAEPGVHQGHVGLEVRLLQILVVGRHLHRDMSVAW